MARMHARVKEWAAAKGLPKLAAALAALALSLASNAAFALREYNLQTPVTPIGEQIFDLHTYILGI